MDARFHNLRVYKEKSETKIDYYEYLSPPKLVGKDKKGSDK